jgi:hypothetical protein
MGAVFVKTPKGQHEVASKSGGLTPRVRRVLIMVDGKRTVDDLRALLLADDLQHTLGLLEEDGYIAIVASSVAGEPLRSITAFAALPATPDPLRLQQARNFMSNTLKVFVGSLGTTSLLDRIERAESHLELRRYYDEWYLAIVTSRDGRREAESLRRKLLDVI